MTAVASAVQGLERRHPEWRPWLTVIEVLLGENANPAWDALVPLPAGATDANAPLLAEATIRFDERLVRGLLDHLLRAACRSGAPKLAGLRPRLPRDIDTAMLFGAALCRRNDRLADVAGALAADPEAFTAIAALAPIPFLQACTRRWRSVESWAQGYCPVCGAWPTLAEVRGIERSRYLRCGPCGAEWEARCLLCPYCGTTDHRELRSLVPGKPGTAGVIEACGRCRGYVKTLTVLEGSSPAAVLLQDLATVDLDVAALEHGYRRPGGAGHPLHVRVAEIRP